MLLSSFEVGFSSSFVVLDSDRGSTVSAFTDEATKVPPIAKTSEQPKRKCFPFFIIRQFFCAVFLLLKYILKSPFYYIV